MKYLETSLFVTAALDPNRTGDASRSLLRRLRAGDFEAATSVLTWDELAYIVGRRLGRDTGLDASRQLLGFRRLRLLPVDADLLREADRAARNHALRPRDAIHLASARRAGATAIVSGDRDFDGIPGLSREWV